ncbi:MAG TPA: hypothetical protein VJN29_02350, partial [Intrasporangium sp.]|nr:hypothetical protein [Intrasporangium sp.]
MPLTTAALSPLERVISGGAGGGERLVLGPLDLVRGDRVTEIRCDLSTDHAELPAEAGLSLEQAAAALVAEIEALEAERARVDGRLVAAYGALHTVIGEQHAAHEAQLPDGWPRESPAEAAVTVEQLVIHEIATATAVPAGEAGRR